MVCRAAGRDVRFSSTDRDVGGASTPCTRSNLETAFECDTQRFHAGDERTVTPGADGAGPDRAKDRILPKVAYLDKNISILN